MNQINTIYFITTTLILQNRYLCCKHIQNKVLRYRTLHIETLGR